MPQPNRIFRPRFRLPLILALAVSQAGAGLALPAQAAPAGDTSYRLVAALDRPKATICVGDTVLAAARLLVVQDDNDLGATRASVWVNGLVADPNVGKFVLARKSIGWNSDRPQEAVFAFHANHAGKTTLTFQAEARYYKSVVYKMLFGPVKYVNSSPVAVTVVNCKYRVKTVSLWKVPGEGYLATMDWTDLTMQANGGFHGTGTAHWSGFWQVVPPGLNASCDTIFTGPASPVSLHAEPDNAGNLLLIIQFDEVTNPNWHAVCHADGGTIPPVDNTVRLAPENLTVILSPNGGGSFKQTQQLIDTISGGRGQTFVVPVAGK
jgi:hypothetical protein